MAYWSNASWHAFGACQPQRSVSSLIDALTTQRPGVAAASHLGGRRFTRPRRLRDYVDWVRAGAVVPPAEAEASEERLLDTLMLARDPPHMHFSASPSCACVF